jgi:hypothetical protein
MAGMFNFLETRDAKVPLPTPGAPRKTKLRGVLDNAVARERANLISDAELNLLSAEGALNAIFVFTRDIPGIYSGSAN